jgi:hypothetical protein
MGRHITVETSLRSHPKFKRLRRAAGLTERDTLGALASLWITVRDVSPDGRLPSWDADDIDEAAGTPGIFQHLISVGFIEHNGDFGLVCHDWMDHSGKQCQDAERKRVERENKSKSSTDSPRTVHGASPPVWNGMEGNGQERNGKDTPSSTAGAMDVLELIPPDPKPSPKRDTQKQADRKDWIESFPLFWEDYPRKDARKDAEKAWVSIQPKDYSRSQEFFDSIIDGLTKCCAEWKREHGHDTKFVPLGATWLRGERWRDHAEEG